MFACLVVVTAHDAAVDDVDSSVGLRLCSGTEPCRGLQRCGMMLTCARDAAATGLSPNSEKICSIGAPSSASTMARASATGKLAMPSCSRLSSAITGAGMTSGRVDTT